MKSKLLLILALALPLSAFAQKYAPHEKWPFVFEDFSRAEVLFFGGERAILDSANISVTDASLYFFRNDSLLRSARPALAVRIEGDDYLLAQTRLMKVLKRTPNGAVLLDVSVDREAMSRSDVGYGFKSSVSSTESRNIMEGSNGKTLSLRMEQQPLGDGFPVKNGGEELLVKEMKYIYLNGGVLSRAVKSDVRSIPWVDKKALNTFWKKNKVSYSNDDSLAALVEFIHSSKY